MNELNEVSIRLKLFRFFTDNPDEQLSAEDAIAKVDGSPQWVREVLRGMEKERLLVSRWERKPGQQQAIKVYGRRA